MAYGRARCAPLRRLVNPQPRDRDFFRQPWLPLSRCADQGSRFNVAPSRLNLGFPVGGTSVKYLTGRLQAAGRTDLLELIAQGRISVYAAGEAAGFFRRPATTGGGSPNASKRRRYELRAIRRRAADAARDRF
jgi:hypothetical protein